MYRYPILALALTLSACSSVPAKLYNPVDYPFSENVQYADLYWRCQTPEGGGARVEGYAMNRMHSDLPVDNLEVRLIARDTKGKTVSQHQSRGNVLDPSTRTAVHFKVSTTTAGEGIHYDLYYHFKVPGEVSLVDHAGTIPDVCGGQASEKRSKPVRQRY